MKSKRYLLRPLSLWYHKAFCYIATTTGKLKDDGRTARRPNHLTVGSTRQLVLWFSKSSFCGYRTMTLNPAVEDPEVLETLYWHEDLSMWEIAQRLNCSETTVYRRMTEFGIDTRAAGHKTGKQQYQYCNYARYRVRDGYPIWEGNNNGDGFSKTFVHQLTLIAHGADPHKVYSDEYACHHKNHVKFDNRPENLVLWTQEEHGRYHANDRGMSDVGSWQEYSDEELLEWIDSFVMEFGVSPSNKDVKGWPGPSPRTYSMRFGSLKEAIKQAGHTPRSET